MKKENEILLMKGMAFLLRGERSSVSRAWEAHLNGLINDLDAAIKKGETEE